MASGTIHEELFGSFSLTSGDFNTAVKQGVWYLGAGADLTNGPANINWDMMLVLGSGTNVTQIVFAARAAYKIYVRRCTNGNWGAWTGASLT